MQEFNKRTECPHCGSEQWSTFPFNFDRADQGGCDSEKLTVECDGCFKTYWCQARVDFDVSINWYRKKKPTGRVR